MTSPIGSRVVATAPVRVADVGGWTDTWFGAPGRVCHVAVGPGVTVDATLVALEPGEAAPVRLVAVDLAEDYRVGPSPDGGWTLPLPGRHPLLEQAVAAALEATPLPRHTGVDVVVHSAVPPGASLGTSASVVVALLGALDRLLGGSRPPDLTAVLAHRVETGRVGRQAGVQDQWAAAFGGCGLLDIGPYPDARRQGVTLPDVIEADLADRLVTVVFGPHDSSAVHERVIDAMTGCGGVDHDRARAALRRLATLAGAAADALRAGELDRWGATLSEATETQATLHPDLVGPAHRAAIAVATELGAAGWKVNGAGGAGGSLTLLAGAGGAAALAAALGAADPRWQVVALRPAPGLRVAVVD